MCHYTYVLYICCSEPKEDDFVQVLDVIFCNECPPSADSELYDDDFFHCPKVTADCLGDSPFLCPQCSELHLITDEHDDVDRGKDPEDEEDDYTDEEEDGARKDVDWAEIYRQAAIRWDFFNMIPEQWQG